MNRRSVTVASFFLLMSLVVTACGGRGNRSPLADAGLDQDINRTVAVTLDGSASSDRDGDTLSYTWTQTYGPDVTGGAMLSGPTQSFTAPNQVSTVMFELEVSDGTSSSTDNVQINIFEEAMATLFVDGDSGNDDSGDGSRDAPFASISAALNAIDVNPMDIYVMSRATPEPYDETATTLNVPTGTSLYGGFDAGWVRDVTTNKTLVSGHNQALTLMDVDEPAWVSGFDLYAADSTASSDDVWVLFANRGTATLYIEDNLIDAGDVAAGAAENAGSSYAVLLIGLNSAEIRGNNMSAGNGGDGAEGTDGYNGSEANPGNNAHGRWGGAGRDTHGDGRSGGNGGDGGSNNPAEEKVGSDGESGEGPLGGAGGSNTEGNQGEDGGHGGGGSTGSSGFGGNSFGNVSSGFVPSNGGDGQRGGHGSGGGGGRGGNGTTTLFFAYTGGGGGGGGAGGGGGDGGAGGTGGGASIGLWLEDVTVSRIEMNTITARNGGAGYSGGEGGLGSMGAAGGTGASARWPADSGGDGGHGGNGGYGGNGGGGGGGPSYGVMVGLNLAPEITSNAISSDAGGMGGMGIGGRCGFIFLPPFPPFRDFHMGGDGGASYAIYDADISDGIVPALLDNSLTFGTGGEVQTGSDGCEGSAGETNF